MSASLDVLFKTFPTDWRRCRLKSVANIRYGLGQPPAQLDSGVAMVRATDVDAGTILTENLLRVDPAELPLDRNPYLKAEEIIVVRSGAYTGDSAIVPPTLEGAIAGYDMVATVTHAVPHFVAYGLLSKYVLEDQILPLTLRAAQPHLNAEQLGSIVLAMPSNRHEQHRIAAYLDASCAAIDAAVAAKRRQLETLARLKKVIITQAVTAGIVQSVEKKPSNKELIGEIPCHWKVEKLKYLTSLIVDGTHITPTYIPEGIPFLRVTDIQEEAINLSEVKYVSPKEHELLNKRAKARRGDILLSKNGTIGIVKVVDWEWEFSFFVSLCLLKPEKRLNPLYFSFFFESSVVEQQIFESSKKTSVTNLHLVKIRELLICVPPPDEQREIVRYLQSRCSDLMTVTRNIEAQITTLTAYRQSLIHECVTGQRRITAADTGQKQGSVHNVPT